jgi:hypothetical protein
MIANFFRSLDRSGVRYLLISGQASVLYGAATFSEDIDLWIAPEQGNGGRLLAALRACRASYYKLTPPLTSRNLRRGHGFHFVLPGRGHGPVFLDVLGAPPRAGTFAGAMRRARRMKTEWGILPTIGLQGLVELKKTQRLEDYPVISKLALAWFDQPECGKTARDFRWAFRNLFTIPELKTFFAEQPGAVVALQAKLAPSFRDFAERARTGKEPTEPSSTRVNALLQRRIADLQRADHRYWRGIIAELKQLRATGELMPEGARV